MHNPLQATRLRYVSGKKKVDLLRYINGLRFKIEIKSIVQENGITTVWFVIPDNVEDLPNKEL